ncbi:MAG: hypothetical protein U0984_08125, partial [Prosthecobacter sp.]|nr:hypothetical protein [Prosthecobacter sp.]
TKSKPAGAFAGNYNATAKVPEALENDASVPQGHGWTQTNVSTAGVITGGGRTPDGGTFTLGGALWPAGQVPIYVLLYKNKGSLHGEELLVSDAASTFANNTLGGTLRLIKTGPSATADRTYRIGYGPVALELDGEKWVKPSTLRLLLGAIDAGINNATLDFAQGGLDALTEDALDQPFRITNTHTAKLALSGGVDNPKKVVLTFSTATGTFTGSFKLVDPNPANAALKITRTVPINGVLRRDQGWGHFVLPEMPGTATSPAWSGAVEIKPGL